MDRYRQRFRRGTWWAQDGASLLRTPKAWPPSRLGGVWLPQAPYPWFIRPMTSSRRALKAAEVVREVVSMAILAELKDPRIRDVTVTHVEVSADLRHAKVHVSVMGDEARQRLSLRGLQSAAGFLQGKVAKRIEARYTPRIEFLLDQGVKKSIEVARLLRQVLPPEPEPPEDEATEGSEDEPLEASGSGRGPEPRRVPGGQNASPPVDPPPCAPGESAASR